MEEKDRQKNYKLLRKQAHCVTPDAVLANKRAPRTHFILALGQVKDLSLDQFSGATNMTAKPATLQFCCTFHDTNVKGGGFFGRTYLSKPFEMTQSRTSLGRFDCDSEDFIYFGYNRNTATKEKDTVRIIVELVARWEERGGLQKTAAIGYTALQIFADNQRGKIRATVE